MADKKTELMAAFFEQCQNHGYTDMHDDMQSLKAKVIATDLNLKYGDIVSFYEKAQKCYDQVQAEKVRAEQLRKIQQQKDAEEAARRSVRGERLVTLANNVNISRSTKVMHVYIRPDKSIYTMADGSEFEGAPAINLHAGGVLLTTFHPSKAVYTGATVGGITTGGVHYTKESYSQRVSNSDKGYITAKIGNIDFTIAVIQVYQCTKMLFKRDPNFQALVSNDRIICQKLNSDTSSFVKLAMTKTDYASQMNVLSVAADQQRLPFDECREITNVLVRIIHGPHPPSDQEAYASAVSFSNAKTAADLKKAIDLFRSISDFRDSADRANALEAVYEEVLQAEKEAAILAKEATSQKRKKLIAIIIPAVLALAILCAALYVFISHRMEQAALQRAYQEAMTLWEQDQFDAAIDAFVALGDYQDASDLVIAVQEDKEETAKMESYAQAMALLEAGDMEAAANRFEQLGDYKDSAELAKNARRELKYQQALDYLDEGQKSHGLAYDLFVQLGDYKDAATYADGFTERIVLKTSKSGNNHEEYEYFYDENGYDATKNWSDDYRKVVTIDGERTITEEYDERGNMVFWSNLNAKGAGYINRYTNTYNEDGTIHSCTFSQVFVGKISGEEPQREAVTTYEYDKNGLLQKTVEIETLEYDRKQGCEPTYFTTCEYSYDSSGKCTGMTRNSTTYKYMYGELLKKTTYTDTYTYTYGWVYTPGAQK